MCYLPFIVFHQFTMNSKDWELVELLHHKHMLTVITKALPYLLMSIKGYKYTEQFSIAYKCYGQDHQFLRTKNLLLNN